MPLPKYTVNWVDSESEIAPELWQAYFPAPYEGHWWYQVMERCGIQDQFTFLYAVVSDSSGTIAIAPAFVMNVPMRLVLPPAILPLANLIGHIVPSALYQRTLFIGSPCSDEGHVGMLDGVNRLAVLNSIELAMVSKAKQLQASMRVWKDFPQQYAIDFTSLNAHLFKVVSFPGTSVELPDATKEGYLATLKSSRRNKLKKKLRLAAESPVDVEVIQQPDSEILNELFNLFWQTYEKGGTKFERLNRKFFDLIAAETNSHFVILREQSNGKIVAFMLCFSLGDQVINKFIGIDYQQPKEWFLYFKLWEAAVDWAAGIGAKSIQSGQTGYAPKIELGNQLVTLTNYCAHLNPVINWVYAKIAKTINWDTLDADLAVYLKAYPDEKPTL